MEENNREYSNDDITVYWRPKKCIHATTCFRELRPVFNPGRRPWVDLSAASTEEIIKVVDMCPTDALTYKWNKDIKNEKEELAPKEQKKEPVEIKSTENQPLTEIRVMPDGPLVVKGDFKVIGADGTEQKKMRITSFCRCGQSLRMPYCDGTHRKVGWASD